MFESYQGKWQNKIYRYNDIIMDFGFTLQPNGLLLGIEYYPIDEFNDFSELNIYLLLIVLHFRVYN